MLWKEKLCIGVDTVDAQHKELFAKVDELLKAVNDSVANHKQECISAILFLKDYAVRHFAEEEAYQQSISYPDFEAHKKLHSKFIESVLQHEKKMSESDFAEKEVKEFTGMLIAWLLYHVADSDQKVGDFARSLKQIQSEETVHSHSEIVCMSVFDVFNKMIGLDFSTMKNTDNHDETFNDSIAVEVTLIGDITGFVTIVYPIEFVKKLVYEMMVFMPNEIGELELSALFEVSNIISGTICRQITKEKGVFCDIETPLMVKRSDIHPDERIGIYTELGVIEVDILIEYAQVG